jgi:hypothetical protein
VAPPSWLDFAFALSSQSFVQAGQAEAKTVSAPSLQSFPEGAAKLAHAHALAAGHDLTSTPSTHPIRQA